MRHLRKGKKLGRVSKKRKALLRSLAIALFENGKIKTTLAKAKALRPLAEKLITKAKKHDPVTLRALSAALNRKTAKTLQERWAPVLGKRNGGYTRIVKLNFRREDASPMACIELVTKPKE
ncbi:MAG: 50S ribosomal protein L17 [Candidatus Moranbacteria bacterium]|nr:50S ribosomal protein L17 [Candidatus Moranbacteria bacterium]